MVSQQSLAILAHEREVIAESTTAWIEGWGPIPCCPRYDVCGACHGTPYPQRHRECWGMSSVERWGHHHTYMDSIGHVRGIADGHLIRIYELGYTHRPICACKAAGHPGIGEGVEGMSDLKWAERVGLTVTPREPVIATDDYGTPSLF